MIKTWPEIVEQIDSIDPLAYAKTRNQHTGAVTKLSPYISHGVISLPFVRDRLLARHTKQDCSKLIQELAWREYFQEVWWAKGDDIFTDLRFSRDDWQHEELVTAIIKHKTGITALDEAVTTLYDTGYMHNHLRMSVASVACNLARAHWYEMGRWLYYHLIDGDPASNFCSWQWVAGTSVNKRYSTNQVVLNACSQHQQSDTWLSYERDEMETVPLPAVLESKTAPHLVPSYPVSDIAELPSEGAVVLYTPWTLNPEFLAEHDGPRVLLIDTNWFDRLPVSESVMSFIVGQGKAVIPDLQVLVGDAGEVFKRATATIHYEAHQTTTDWPGVGVERAKLFPGVAGYYPSFFKYWQKVSRTR